jgi:SAM-dependent methyltransferase
MPTIKQVAESFGSDAERYDRTRPRYPAAIVERTPGQDVLDVGCGTGIVARQFQAAGRTVLGVEPDERMAEFARRHGTEVEVATIETWEPAGRTFDAVVAGQTWHWVDPVAGAATAARVLRPGGRLTVFWNVFQTPPDLTEAFAAVYQRVMPDLPMLPRVMPSLDAYSPIFTRTVDGMREVFAEPEEWRVDWTRDYTREEWLDQIPTFGGHSLLPAAQLDELLTGIGTAIGDGFTMDYTTVVVTARR